MAYQFEKGNKHSVGHGRPKYDREEWAQKLLDWSELDDSINLNGFCGDNGIHIDTMYTMVKDSEGFSDAYKIAKTRIAARRERMVSEGTLHTLAYSKNAGAYDKVLHKYERGEKEFEAGLKKIIEDTTLRSQLEEFLNKFKEQ